METRMVGKDSCLPLHMAHCKNNLGLGREGLDVDFQFTFFAGVNGLSEAIHKTQ